MRGAFDAVIAPYHDVGMTAIKVASFGGAVNVTLGLPFPRCSPDHGTALDIAGQGMADPSSMIESILLCARHRAPHARNASGRAAGDRGASAEWQRLVVLAAVARRRATRRVRVAPEPSGQRGDARSVGAAAGDSRSDERFHRRADHRRRACGHRTSTPISQYLLDVIGPRLTGSAAARRANEWTRQKFREYGADRAELEPWTFGVGWTARRDDDPHARAAEARAARRVVGLVAGNERAARGRRRVHGRAHASRSSTVASPGSCAARG